jgi:2-oxoglutarate ferredoxin oxidoreductase subunit alpha
MSADDLEKIQKFSRYLDTDGDGIAARTYPGVHPRGGYFTRGSGHDKHAAYTEDSDAYLEVVDRLAKKLRTAADRVPAPEMHLEGGGAAEIGLISLGGTHGAMLEAVDRLRKLGHAVDYMRIRAFPFSSAIREFIEAHPKCYVVEQNRDGQLRSLIAIETGIARDRMRSILDYGGLPLTADRVVNGVRGHH